MITCGKSAQAWLPSELARDHNFFQTFNIDLHCPCYTDRQTQTDRHTDMDTDIHINTLLRLVTGQNPDIRPHGSGNIGGEAAATKLNVPRHAEFAPAAQESGANTDQYSAEISKYERRSSANANSGGVRQEATTVKDRLRSKKGVQDKQKKLNPFSCNPISFCSPSSGSTGALEKK